MPKTKEESRERRKLRIRKRISGTSERPRVVVFRSSQHIYVQVIDDLIGKTLLAVSTLDKELKPQLEGIKKRDAAKRVGVLLASRCISHEIKKVVFDRSGYIYHGRVKALAEGAREGGLDF